MNGLDEDITPAKILARFGYTMYNKMTVNKFINRKEKKAMEDEQKEIMDFNENEHQTEGMDISEEEEHGIMYYAMRKRKRSFMC